MLLVFLELHCHLHITGTIFFSLHNTFVFIDVICRIFIALAAFLRL